MTETIGNVKLNLDKYEGTDTYSDGDIEDKLLEIVKTKDDLEEVLMNENEWPILYHLSDIRKNILEWYDFNPEGTLLEIGAGCGAVTGLFCNKCKRVVANDLSKRRSTINAYRNKKYDNLEIMVSNFEDLEITEKFDYVTLIGVLEYAVYYIHSENPFVDMLKKCREYLKPGGTLFIAIENKYGMKYWAGAREDHTGGYFDGLEGYPNGSKAKTFGKDQLTKLVMDAGFSSTYYYYPLPDYKLPMEIYSDDYLPSPSAFTEPTPAYDNDRIMTFNEPLVFSEVTKDGMFPFFSNSFLVECSN